MLPLVSHGKYADGILGTDKQTDGRQTVTLRFLLDAASGKVSRWRTGRERVSSGRSSVVV